MRWLPIVALIACETDRMPAAPTHREPAVEPTAAPVPAPASKPPAPASTTPAAKEAAKEAPAKESPRVSFFGDRNRKVLDSIIDKNLDTSALAKFTGVVPGELVFRELAITGGLDRSSTDRALRGRSTRFRRCYDHEPQPRLGGKITASFMVMPTGKITGAKATGVDRAVAGCIVKELGMLALMAPSSGTAEVSVELRFSP